jgi:NitT/TauT family transport system substrate-binding protein
MPLQTNPNSVAAVTGGSADAAVSVYPYLAAALDTDDVKLLGFIGDETPWQLTAVFTATATANDKRDLVERFLRAVRKGTRDYHAAFTGPDEKRKDGPTASETLALLAKNTGQPIARVAAGIGYVDRDARIDVEDIDRQVVWYKAQNLLKGDRTGAELVDMRYALKLPH